MKLAISIILLMSLALGSEMMFVHPAVDEKLDSDLPGSCALLHRVYDFDTHLATLVVKDISEHPDKHLESGISCVGTLKMEEQPGMEDVMWWTVIGDEWMYNEGTMNCEIEDDGSLYCAINDDYTEDMDYVEAMDMPDMEEYDMEMDGGAEMDEPYVFESETLKAIEDGSYSLDHWDEEYELSVGELQWIHNDYAETLTELALADWPEGSTEQLELLTFATTVSAEAEAMTETTRRRLGRRRRRAGKRKACPKKDAMCIRKFEKAVNKLLGHARSEEQALGEKWCKKPDHKRHRRGIRCCSGWNSCGPYCAKGTCLPLLSRQTTLGCCGSERKEGFYCYEEAQVCPPRMVTCSPWGGGRYCDLWKSGECTMKTIEGWVMVLDICANVAAMMFSGGASTAAKAAIKTGAKAVGKASGKAAMRAAARAAWKVGKQVAKNMKQNLLKHFRRVGKELSKELTGMIQEEAMTIFMGDMAKKEGWMSKEELAELIDPTGVVALVNFINSADQCIYPPSMSESEMGELEDTAFIEPEGVDINVYTENAGMGGWGGLCTCPNGETYGVGDNHNSCGSLACVNGEAGKCLKEGGGWSGAKVECDPNPDNYIENAGMGGWGGFCTCPNGAVYPVGDEHNACGSLACVGGDSGKCYKFGGEWSGNKVECAGSAETHSETAKSQEVMDVVAGSNSNSVVYGFAVIGIGAMFYYSCSKLFGKEEYTNIEEPEE